MISICALGVIAAGCDTGDGKQLKPYDPADYPAPVVETTIAEDTIAEGLDSELVVDPTVGPDLGFPSSRSALPHRGSTGATSIPVTRATD